MSEGRTVATFGGGVNSTAMILLLIDQGRIPDLILFADTGGERPETYAHVAAFSEWLKARNAPEVTIVREKVTLEADCLRRKALPSIAYGFKTCSQRWKLQPQEKFLRAWRNEGEIITKLIGYDAGEPHRAKDYDDAKTRVRYPLIEANIFREDCEEMCAAAGFHNVSKSSCTFCPNMRKHEIRDLAKTHPDLAARAIAMEQNAELTTVKGLGRNFSWADFLANEANVCEFDFEKAMPCGCYD